MKHKIKAGPISALMPFTAQLLEQVAEARAAEQLAPLPVPFNPVMDVVSLKGSPQLLAVAQNDPTLALKLQWLINECEAANWEEALGALDHVAFSIRSLRLDTAADEMGVAR